jgi:hypothetical protein
MIEQDEGGTLRELDKIGDQAVCWIAGRASFKVTTGEVCDALKIDPPTGQRALHRAQELGRLARSGRFWTITDAGRNLVLAYGILPEVDRLSDYVWAVVEWLVEHDEHGTRFYSATQVSRADTALRGDHGFIMAMLKAAERRGLVQRQRNGVSSPWMWITTGPGRDVMRLRATRND